MLNLLSEQLRARLPYCRLRYVDFAPRFVLQSIVDAIPPLAGKQLPFTDAQCCTYDWALMLMALTLLLTYTFIARVPNRRTPPPEYSSVTV
jgi:hypothetical protein